MRSWRDSTWLSLRLALPALALGLASCAHTVAVNVDSLAKPNAADAVSYQIANRSGNDSESLRYQEAERAVKRALAGRGLYEAPDPAKADLIVNLDYGISDPRVVEVEKSEPIYEFNPGGTYTELIPVRDSAGRVVLVPHEVFVPPHQEQVGERKYIVKQVVYEKYLKLSARENKAASDAGQPQEVWTVDATSEGESTNLRKYIPILAAATIENIGKDTKGQKTIRIRDKDENGPVAFVKDALKPDEPAAAPASP